MQTLLKKAVEESIINRSFNLLWEKEVIRMWTLCCEIFTKSSIKSGHEGKKSHQYNICLASFSTKRGLAWQDTHIYGIHEKKKQFKCELCDLFFEKV